MTTKRIHNGLTGAKTWAIVDLCGNVLQGGFATKADALAAVKEAA
jgi:uncharacterized protein YfaQ (DUF2300 family)